MNIKGFTGDLDRWRSQFQNSEALNYLGIKTNAFYNTGVVLNSDGKSGDAGNVQAAAFDASRSWSGETSSNGFHNHTFTGNTGDTASTGGSETRPQNFTIRIWKRIA